VLVLICGGVNAMYRDVLKVIRLVFTMPTSFLVDRHLSFVRGRVDGFDSEILYTALFMTACYAISQRLYRPALSFGAKRGWFLTALFLT